MCTHALVLFFGGRKRKVSMPVLLARFELGATQDESRYFCVCIEIYLLEGGGGGVIRYLTLLLIIYSGVVQCGRYLIIVIPKNVLNVPPKKANKNQPTPNRRFGIDRSSTEAFLTI